MHSGEFKSSLENGEAIATELNFRDWEHLPPDYLRLRLTWSEAMKRFSWGRDYYMEHYDSPEQRLKEKNPERFVLP